MAIDVAYRRRVHCLYYNEAKGQIVMKETIIIGPGISGMSAAIYAARKRMDYVLLGEDVGGQMSVSGEILNYPGVVESDGADFEERFRKQLEYNDVNLVKENVESITDQGDHWEVSTRNETYTTKSVIIATGSHPRKLGVPGEEAFAKKGVTYCAICDGPLFTDKDVAVIGGGDAALEAVDFMHELARTIYVINIGAELNAHEYLVEQVKGMDNVEIISEAETKEIYGDQLVEGITYEQNGEEKQLEVAGAVIEIGRIPNTDLAAEHFDLDDHGHFKVDRWCRCHVGGEPSGRAYAVGDCTDVHEYQYAISAGMGVTALLKAARWLSRQQ